jgi:2-oxoglutarate dehydrogenase E1 component
MYGKIRDRMSIRDLYTEHLVMAGELSTDEFEMLVETFHHKMEEKYQEVRESKAEPAAAPVTHGFSGTWTGLSPQYSFAPVETGVPYEILRTIAEAAATVPAGFQVNPKVERIFAARRKAVESQGMLDWAAGEMLALGSLLLEKTSIRVTGQDSRRGTFSQRHAVVVDMETGADYYPLKNLAPEQGELCIYDSMLSEAAVLGFDYGYSLDEPHMLIVWEAQFGDFANGAQVIIDQFIASGESKWGRGSGLVLLLPHGYEGQGPEHSSARLERFLSLCAEDNIQVVNPTTPAQYFHLLRRQVRRNFRKPLIVMTPKSLLRHKQAVSPVEHLVSSRFQEVLDDPAGSDQARRVLVCSGKVYYDLLAHREALGKNREVAIVRLEQFYPWPVEMLKATLARYRAAREWVWVQEESQNMGGWTFVAPRLQELMGTAFQYVGRDASASTATGAHDVHDREQAELVEAAIGSSLPHLVSAHPGLVPAVTLALKQGVH